jgi:hypothetical protein
MNKTIWIKYNNKINCIILWIDQKLYDLYEKQTFNKIKNKEKKWFIYWLSSTDNESGIFYIWQTNNFFLRFYQHINLTSLNNDKKK